MRDSRTHLALQVWRLWSPLCWALAVLLATGLVRTRAGMPDLSGVGLDEVLDEKFAELGMEWGKRYYDMIRVGRFDELSYDGRTFSEAQSFLPYPQSQVDQFPILDN